MKKAGLWINENKTVIVLLVNSKIQIHQLYPKPIVCCESCESQKKNRKFTQKGQSEQVVVEVQLNYFEHVIDYLSGSQVILITGPDCTSEKFYIHLRNKYKGICNNVCNVKHLDFMTDPKIANYFINFFSTKNEKRELSSY